MPIVLGTDLGTSTITAVAIDTDSGALLARSTRPNESEITSPTDRAAGFSEWDVAGMAGTACACLADVANALAPRRQELAGLGITGQQHGMVLVTADLSPRRPFINWQDRRGEQRDPRTGKTYVQRALELAGEEAPRRTGCRLATGYLALTLFWMKETGPLPADTTACFAPDYFAALLTGQPPVTDPTCAASSGVFDVTAGNWDPALLEALELPRAVFPEVRPCGEKRGSLTPNLATRTGLPAGLPVFVGMGDNQASFLGSVARREEEVLVNVGTGSQVAAHTGRFVFSPELETRPFPGGGYLLVCAGLSGGRSYAVLERFFRAVGTQLFELGPNGPLYPVMNELAAQVAPGAGGLRCEPLFSGTRTHPEWRGSWTGVGPENFTPAHLTRALLEGMARTFLGGYEAIRSHLEQLPARLVGAGNGLRENPLLADIVAQTFGLPLALPEHREEAAYGAALLAAWGAGFFPDLASAGRLLRYQGG